MTATAVLLVSFGGPEGPDEVMPFLERVTAGRGIPPERLAEVGAHYVALGGVSPINAQNRALLAALRAELDARGRDLPLYWGNRNSAPYLAEAVAQLAADGHAEVLALLTSAYSSYSGCRQYRENIAGALAEADAVVRVRTVGQYCEDEGFLLPFAEGLARALDDLAAQGIDAASTEVLCSTHSLPVVMAEGSGPGGAGWYVAQHEAAMARVAQMAARLTSVPVPEPRLVFQSRSGPPTMPWLEPDVNAVIEESASAGARAVVLVPLGFISDHVEVVWDLDTQAAETAARMGVELVRVPTPGTHPAFVAALADRIEGALAGPCETSACTIDCCVNPRASLPAVPGPGGGTP